MRAILHGRSTDVRETRVGAGADEAGRLEVLRSYGVLDTGPEPLFDGLTALAAELCGTPMASVTLVDDDRQWFKSTVGVQVCETDREDSFCAHALHRPDLLVVPDTRADPRFRHNPLVTGAPHIAFYAGAPLISPEGLTLGTLCVLDTRPRTLSEPAARHLTTLAGQVMALLEARRLSNRLAAEVGVRRQTEQTLQANERLLRGVLSHPDAVIYAKDLDGRYILGNDALDTLFGAPAGSLLGRTDAEIVGVEASAEFRRIDRQVTDSGRRLVVEETLAHPDGSVRHYLSTKFPLWDEAGEVYGVAGMSTDLTAQVETAARVSASERRWRQLFDGSPVGIGLVDDRGRVVAANASMCELVGRPADQVIGAAANSFAHPDDLARFVSARDLLRDSGDAPVQVEIRYQRPDGTLRWAWLTVAPTPGPAGEPWVLAYAQDITERLAVDQVVRDSEANLSAVAEVVAEIQAGSDARDTIIRACAELTRARYVCLFEPDPDGDVIRVTRTDTPDLAGVELARSMPSPICRAFDDPPVGPDAGPGATFADPSSADTTVLVVPVRAGDAVIAVLTLGFDGPVPAPGGKRDNVARLLAAQAGVAMRQSAMLAELADRAATDALTGLPNRRGWDDAVGALARERRVDQRVVLALIDFDRFKQFNDTRGHSAGDDLLRGFADRARRVLRAGDVLARWGGEEFALALVDCPGDAVDVVLERVAASMPQEQTCSVGWADLPPGGDVAQVMIEADAALYVAKNAGRACIRHF